MQSEVCVCTYIPRCLSLQCASGVEMSQNRKQVRKQSGYLLPLYTTVLCGTGIGAPHIGARAEMVLCILLLAVVQCQLHSASLVEVCVQCCSDKSSGFHALSFVQAWSFESHMIVAAVSRHYLTPEKQAIAGKGFAYTVGRAQCGIDVVSAQTQWLPLSPHNFPRPTIISPAPCGLTR